MVAGDDTLVLVNGYGAFTGFARRYLLRWVVDKGVKRKVNLGHADLVNFGNTTGGLIYSVVKNNVR